MQGHLRPLRVSMAILVYRVDQAAAYLVQVSQQCDQRGQYASGAAHRLCDIFPTCSYTQSGACP
eukprot:3820927-Pyramimonas_sp.AAC.1